MSYRPSVIATLLALLATPASAGNVIDPYTLFPPAAPTGIAYESVGATTQLASTEVGTTRTLALPGSLAANDLLIAWVISGPASGATTATTGWTRVTAEACTDWNICLTSFYNAVSSPGSVVAPEFTIDDGKGISGFIMRFSGGTSVDAGACTQSNTATTTLATPNVTPTEATGIIVSAAVVYSGGAFTSPPATTVATLNSGGTDWYGLSASYAASSGTSSQGSVNFNLVAGATHYKVCSLAIH